MKHIICIVAKTGRGKDTLAKQITKHLGIKQICSYTTRPKRDCEVDGREHYFITDKQADEILYKDTILALACKPNGVRYFATLESFDEDRAIYVIDPEGIDWMRKNVEDKNLAKLFIVELYAKNKDIEERIRLRGDDFEAYKKRIEYEDIEFEQFHKDESYDVSISATLTVQQVYETFVKAYNEWLLENDQWKDV